MYQEPKPLHEEIAALKESMAHAVWQAKTTIGFDNSRGTTLYDYQVDFCYLINSIERDSKFIAYKQIPKVRELISNLRKECSEAKEARESKED